MRSEPPALDTLNPDLWQVCQWLRVVPEQALVRIGKHPEELWTVGVTITLAGRKDLVGVAQDWVRTGTGWKSTAAPTDPSVVVPDDIELAYDRACLQLGAEYVGRVLKDTAKTLWRANHATASPPPQRSAR